MGARRARAPARGDGPPRRRLARRSRALRGELAGARLLSLRAADLLDRGEPASAASAMAKLAGARLAQRIAREGIELLGLEGLADGHAAAPLEGRIGALYRASVGSTISGGSAEILQTRHRSTWAGSAMSLPLAGVRVVEYAQYVAGPLCGVLLADLGADVVKVEPPAGDGYRHVMPVAPGIGRYFVPLNRGKRSVVARPEDATTGSRRASGCSAKPTSCCTTSRASARSGSGSTGRTSTPRIPALVVGRVSSFGTSGPLADAPAYDLVAQARAGLLTAHASPRRRGPGARGRHPDGRPHRRLPARDRASSPRSCARARPGRASSSTSRSSPPRWPSSSRISSGSTGEADGDEPRRGGPGAARRARGRDRRRCRDEPVLPLLRGLRRLRRRRLPQPRAAAGVPRRSSASTTRRSTRPTSSPTSRRSSLPRRS